MRRDLIDFFLVPDSQMAVHLRLENWSRWVSVRISTRQHPMWAKSRSNARQWHEPDLKEATDLLDGHAIEKGVSQLPFLHRDALRWYYVHRGGPLHMARRLGVTKDGLSKLVQDARQMLVNRRV